MLFTKSEAQTWLCCGLDNNNNRYCNSSKGTQNPIRFHLAAVSNQSNQVKLMVVESLKISHSCGCQLENSIPKTGKPVSWWLISELIFWLTVLLRLWWNVYSNREQKAEDFNAEPHKDQVPNLTKRVMDIMMMKKTNVERNIEHYKNEGVKLTGTCNQKQLLYYCYWA